MGATDDVTCSSQRPDIVTTLPLVRVTKVVKPFCCVMVCAAPTSGNRTATANRHNSAVRKDANFFVMDCATLPQSGQTANNPIRVI